MIHVSLNLGDLESKEKEETRLHFELVCLVNKDIFTGQYFLKKTETLKSGNLLN